MKCGTREELLQEWFANQVSSYETIKAPKVGTDIIADNWMLHKYSETNKSAPPADFLQQNKGYYVIDLAPELDGVPVYIAMGQDRNVFRAEFLKDCKNIIGDELLHKAWETQLAPEVLKYGNRLMAIADDVAAKNNLLYLKEQRDPPGADEDSLESKIHILYAAAKWLMFYGKNGHGVEASF